MKLHELHDNDGANRKVNAGVVLDQVKVKQLVVE